MGGFGRYELLALLAKGGLAEIWLARQSGMAGFEKLVVVKRLHERLQPEREYVDMFLDEARINARLQHTNVLSVYELGEIDGRYFLTMEYIEGLPLGVLAKKAQERIGDLPIAIAGGLMVQAAHGLHYSHEAIGADGAPMNIVHRDLSPLNLLVSFDGVLKIADFGVAKADGRLTHTKSGMIKGTPTYMSPEQCTGEPMDRRSDVFALGILLWEILTGKRLFKRDIIDDTYRAITSGAIPPPSTHRLELPTSLDALTLRALARRPADRFQTAEELRHELETVLHREGLRAEVVDVRAFLEKHFQPERVEQEELLKKVRKGPLKGQRAPLFDSAEHGLDSGEREGPRDLAYSDGDTERESGIPGAMVDAIFPSASDTPSYTAADKPQPPPKPSSGMWKLVLLVALLVFVAAMIGLIAGKVAGPK
jgi:serine/threonine protein kinase